MGNSQGSYEISPSKYKNGDSDSEDGPLGMESCAIPASRITASSSTDTAPAFYARLNGTKSWCAGSPADCFLEVDLDTIHYVTAVATQGNPSGNRDYVKMYKIQYSKDGLEWGFYQEHYKQVLEGNIDNFSTVKRKIDPRIKARYVRFWPTAWFQWPCLRVEIYGRPAPEETKSQNESITLEPQEGHTMEDKDFEQDIEDQNERFLEENVSEEEMQVQEIKDTSEVGIMLERLDNDREAKLEQETTANDVKAEEYKKIFESLDTSTPVKPNVVVNKQTGISETEEREVLESKRDNASLRRMMEVKTKLEFEAEARKLCDEQFVEMRRKKNKKVTLGFDTPDYLYIPRRVYNDMWGDSPSGSLSEGLDNQSKEGKSLIEKNDGGAPLAKLDDDVIEEAMDQGGTVLIRTIWTRVEGIQQNSHNPDDDNCAHTHDVAQNNKDGKIVTLSQETSQCDPEFFNPSPTEKSNSESDFLLLNGFGSRPIPFAARASCEHLHPADPAVQVAMESSFSERVDSLDQINIDPLTNRRFSGLDLLQSPYDAVSGDDIERLLAWEDETLPGWTRIKKTRDYEVLKGTAIAGGPPIIKTVITLKRIAYDEAVRRITEWEIRKEWDKTFDKLTFIEQSYNFNVIHCAIKKQGLTLAILDDVDIDEPYHASVWSVADHPDSSMLSKGKPLRYETMISGLVIRPTRDGFPSSRVTLLCQVKGSISPSLRNSFLVGSADKWVEMLKKFSPKKKNKK